MQSEKILHLFNQLNAIDQEEIHIICRHMAESMALEYDGNCGINTDQESEFWKWETDTWQEIKTYMIGFLIIWDLENNFHFIFEK